MTTSPWTTAGLGLPHDEATPLYRRLYDALRLAILDGRLAPGARLPSSRSLAAELGVSRNTVLSAFDQLMAEGYLRGRVGAGTFVTTLLPEELLQVERTGTAPAGTPQEKLPALSQRMQRLLATHRPQHHAPARAFQPGIPALDHFPTAVWEQLLVQSWRALSADELAYRDPVGSPWLCETIAAHLRATRGARCRAHQVIIVSGAQQALQLAAFVLLDPGDSVWMEEPGYAKARQVLAGAGAHLTPTPVDEEGLHVAAGVTGAPNARLAYVTPSHQYPLGMTMSLARRGELLAWARQSDSWILEDDYDSEYRFGGRPLAALQGLDGGERVVYLGTLSKVLFPGLRLGYLVAPPALVDAFRAARSFLDRAVSPLLQATVAAFIAEGHLARHLRRMNRLYAQRQAILLDAMAGNDLIDRLLVRPRNMGLHLTALLPSGVDDRALSARLAERGVLAPPLSAYHMAPADRGGLVLGFAGYDETAIHQGMAVIADELG